MYTFSYEISSDFIILMINKHVSQSVIYGHKILQVLRIVATICLQSLKIVKNNVSVYAMLIQDLNIKNHNCNVYPITRVIK